jgi:hypothetical protein
MLGARLICAGFRQLLESKQSFARILAQGWRKCRDGEKFRCTVRFDP